MPLDFVSARDIERLDGLHNEIDGFAKTDRLQIGDWGIFPLCCGWAAAQNSGRAAGLFEMIQPQDAFAAGFGILQPYMFAMQVGSRLETLAQLEGMRALAVQRLRTLPRLTEDDIQQKTPYLTLAIVLNSIEPSNEDLLETQQWLDGHSVSWTELFFAVGMLRGRELQLSRIASTLASIQPGPVRSRFVALLNTYNGSRRGA